MTALRAKVRAVSIWGPGLEGWAASRPILAGTLPYEPRDSPPPPPAILPPTERRRAGPVVRLALAVAHEAAIASGLDPASLRSVFGSSNGDGVVVGSILDALARGAPGERVVSPTQFHNSVHNAAAGYWSIATGSRQPATCLGAHDWTWAASLLKAMVEVASERQPVLLCCYDHPLPPPLDRLRPTVAAFGAGLVLAPEDGEGSVLGVEYSPASSSPLPGSGRGRGWVRRASETSESASSSAPTAGPELGPALDALTAGNAVAQALPLLAALARGGHAEHCVAYAEGHLRITVSA